MEDKLWLKKVMDRFLIAELQEILNSVGVSSIGKKDTLRIRVRNLLKQQSVEVERKVEEIHRRRQQQQLKDAPIIPRFSPSPDPWLTRVPPPIFMLTGPNVIITNGIPNTQGGLIMNYPSATTQQIRLPVPVMQKQHVANPIMLPTKSMQVTQMCPAEKPAMATWSAREVRPKPKATTSPAQPLPEMQIEPVAKALRPPRNQLSVMQGFPVVEARATPTQTLPERQIEPFAKALRPPINRLSTMQGHPKVETRATLTQPLPRMQNEPVPKDTRPPINRLSTMQGHTVVETRATPTQPLPGMQIEPVAKALKLLTNQLSAMQGHHIVEARATLTQPLPKMQVKSLVKGTTSPTEPLPAKQIHPVAKAITPPVEPVPDKQIKMKSVISIPNADIRLKPVPFYDVLDTLLRPSILRSSGRNLVNETIFRFGLTQSQLSCLFKSKNLSTAVFAVQIQLRVCLLEKDRELEDHFPPKLRVHVNKKECPIPVYKPWTDAKKISRPLIISKLCTLCSGFTNNINVSWGAERNREYVLGVYLVRMVTSAKMIARLREKEFRYTEETLDLLKEKLQVTPETEMISSLRISLNCPIGKSRMTIPCRATSCNHVQCFDASMFLMMNEKKATWLCPVCNKRLDFESLFIDDFFTHVCLEVPRNCAEIEFHEDGSWTPVVQEEKVEEEEKNIISDVIPKSSAPVNPLKRKPVEIIDLTEGDEDEETQSVVFGKEPPSVVPNIEILKPLLPNPKVPKLPPQTPRTPSCCKSAVTWADQFNRIVCKFPAMQSNQ